MMDILPKVKGYDVGFRFDQTVFVGLADYGDFEHGGM